MTANDWYILCSIYLYTHDNHWIILHCAYHGERGGGVGVIYPIHNLDSTAWWSSQVTTSTHRKQYNKLWRRGCYYRGAYVHSVRGSPLHQTPRNYWTQGMTRSVNISGPCGNLSRNLHTYITVIFKIPGTSWDWCEVFTPCVHIYTHVHIQYIHADIYTYKRIHAYA